MRARRSRPVRRDPGLALMRALLADAPPSSAAVVAETASTGWASATFTGARHAIRLVAIDDAALAAWLDELPDARLPLDGHLLVDIAVTASRRREGLAIIDLEALTVEDA